MGFGAVLARLLSHKGLSVSFLARQVGIPEPVLQAVLDGGVPDGALIRGLAPELGLHVADLFVIAGMPVPGELAPVDDLPRVDKGFGMRVAGLVEKAMKLPPESRTRLLDFLRSLPQQDRAQPVPAVSDHGKRFPAGLGKILVLMLGNRNLDWMTAADLIYHVDGLMLSVSMIESVGAGREEVNPRLLAAFSAVLGIPFGDLAAIGGLEFQAPADPENRDGADMAALIWEARRLTNWQVRQAEGQILARMFTLRYPPGKGTSLYSLIIPAVAGRRVVLDSPRCKRLREPLSVNSGSVIR